MPKDFLIAIADKARPAFRRSVERAIAAATTAVRAGQDTPERTILSAWAEEAVPRIDAAMRDMQQQVMTTAGKATLSQVQKDAAWRFDIVNPRAVAYVQRHTGRMIVQITNTQRVAVQQAIGRVVSAEISVGQAQKHIRSVIGLTDRMESAVWNVRIRSLEAGMRPKRVDAVVSKYREKLIKARAETIARTETIQALSAGREEAWQQAIDDGLLPPSSEKKWVVTYDDRLAIVGGKTKVLTIDGWRPISEIEVGAKVLTHNDRFCTVTSKVVHRYTGPTVTINTGTREARRVHVTYGHPVLVYRMGSDEWVKAEELMDTDEVYLSAVPCGSCGGLRVSGPRDTNQDCHPCSIKKTNTTRWSQPGQREKLVERNIAMWTPERRSLASARWTGEANPVREGLKARGRKNYGMSYLERKIRWFLSQQGIEFEDQWMFRYGPRQSRGFADFYLPGPNVVIECDGPLHMTDEEVKAKDIAKDEYLAGIGVHVMRFSDSAIRKDFTSVATAIRQRCCFVRRKIKSLTHGLIKGQAAYHLTIDGDESFIAGGVVVHNCPYCAPLAGERVRLGELFSGGVDYPPLHPRCRCAITIVRARTVPTRFARIERVPVLRR